MFLGEPRTPAFLSSRSRLPVPVVLRRAESLDLRPIACQARLLIGPNLSLPRRVSPIARRTGGSAIQASESEALHE